MANIISPKELIEMLKDKTDVYVEFVKKDKTLRKMKATLNFNNIPKEKYPKSSEKKEIEKDIKEPIVEKDPFIRAFDREKLEWRGFKFSSILKVIYGGKTFLIKQ